METDIFIKSYKKDFGLLEYALMSITKNVIGYNELHIVIPRQDNGFLDRSWFPKRTIVHLVVEYGNPYIFQQLCKMKAHNYCDAPYILFTDSDCLISQPTNLKESIKNGKPEILMTSYFDDKGFNQLGGALCWQYPTQLFFNQKCDYEYMRRNGLLYHKSTLENLENRFNESNPTQTLEQYIMAQDRISEFNLMGKFAHLYEPEKYIFTDTKDWAYKPAIVEQLWSYGTKDGDETHQREYARSLETINRVLGLNITEI